MPCPYNIRMKNYFLILGDILALFLTTLIGFITHGETEVSFLPRFLAAFIPLLLAWFLLAPWFGLFEHENISNPRQLWRPVLAMVFSVPLAVVLRGFVLHSAVLPVFVMIFGATSALGLIIWRGLYFFLRRKS
jgi:hypothetical protein